MRSAVVPERQSAPVRKIVQPGLAGFTDGSVSTLAPIFATVFASHSSHRRFSSAQHRRSAPGSRYRFMQARFALSIVQVVGGGVLVLVTAAVIGSS